MLPLAIKCYVSTSGDIKEKDLTDCPGMLLNRQYLAFLSSYVGSKHFSVSKFGSLCCEKYNVNLGKKVENCIFSTHSKYNFQHFFPILTNNYCVAYIS